MQEASKSYLTGGILKKATRFWALCPAGAAPSGVTDGTLPAYLLQLFPAVAAAPHHHGPQLWRLEELKHFATAHLPEAAGEGCVPLMH